MYAITTEVKGKVLFVSECSKRSLDKKYLVEYTADESDARRFEKKEVLEIIGNIVNPHEREFKYRRVSNKTRKVLNAIEDFK